MEIILRKWDYYGNLGIFMTTPPENIRKKIWGIEAVVIWILASYMTNEQSNDIFLWMIFLK